MPEQTKISPVVALSLLGILTLAVVFWAFWEFQKQEAAVVQKPASKDALLVINYGDGKIRKFKGPIEQGAKIWDLLQQAIAVGGINVKITDTFVPESIDGFQNDGNGKNWSLYVNNAKQKFTPFEINTKPGDEITFKFE